MKNSDTKPQQTTDFTITRVIYHRNNLTSPELNKIAHSVYFDHVRELAS